MILNYPKHCHMARSWSITVLRKMDQQLRQVYQLSYLTEIILHREDCLSSHHLMLYFILRGGDENAT